MATRISIPIIALMCCSLMTHAAHAVEFSATDYSEALQKKLHQALQSKPAGSFRSQHLDANGRPLFANRLLLAISPYLQQHAHNPVDWHPWNEETREKARALGKPIFLSIGYATCHWCHVMEEESFDNLEIAALINKLFLPVKVDRESQPSVDRAYMAAMQRMIGQGGWPLNVILSPEGYPFTGGTYFTPDHFRHILKSAHALWTEDKTTITRNAKGFWEAVHNDTRLSTQAANLDATLLKQTAELFAEDMDELQGGFGHAPKFPRETRLLFLLDEHARQPNPELAEKLRTTLEQMARGALFDQLAGGFHRYTVDNNWHEPHYEKMLYNQANLLLVYLRAWEQFGNPDDARIVQLTANYLLREMRDKSGLFYAASDADSEGEEGLYYTWTKNLIEQALGQFKTQRLLAHYAIATPENSDERGPLVIREDAIFTSPPPEIDALREVLRSKRAAREAPLIDRKLITAWNARTITALAQAGASLAVPEWQQAASEALEALWTSSYRPGVPLARFTIDGKSGGEGTLDDYAALLEALMISYRIDNHPKWLTRAQDLAELTLVLFRDRQSGVFYETRAGSNNGLGFRSRSRGDDPAPDSTGTTLRAFSLLFQVTGDRRWEKATDGLLATQAHELTQSPWRWAWLLHQWRNYRNGEISTKHWAANGKVAIRAQRRGNNFSVELDITDGWHLQSANPSHPDLVPTNLYRADGSILEATASPGAELVATGIKKTPMSLYSGRQTLNAELEESHTRNLLSIKLQACDDRLCLPPEVLWLGF